MGMTAIILAGGLGTRLSEETILKPKPMVEIGNMPILWHILKIYSAHGIHDFIICCGYKGYIIKEYFANYFFHNSDLKIDLSQNSIEIIGKKVEPWNITLVDTGQETMTGGRLKRAAEYLPNNDTFCLTYGDGVSNVNLSDEIHFHKSKGKLATVLAVKPQSRFGALSIEDNIVTNFDEKPTENNTWINGGFFVLEREVVNLIENDQTVWEHRPLTTLANRGELMAYKHDGFWHPMDTLRDKKYLDDLWNSSNAPWKRW